ncbi:MAG: hypothetical protein LAT75_12770 [Candidatus Cyclonatronum sp.]|uniref:FliG C-terminal domain-containing protein n=1 Tax=Cyclonatronum sp. TaxID=3024185 RepID=UPI0025BA7627|nr:FliG C-terminal domain-containing protein [Cyclonatronum sp.]MCC5935444.1 hypothetical protein [Balneolales bacterium]MCH8487734.1 hypothetical protein [Cyclonatronum sp.]
MLKREKRRKRRFWIGITIVVALWALIMAPAIIFGAAAPPQQAGEAAAADTLSPPPLSLPIGAGTQAEGSPVVSVAAATALERSEREQRLDNLIQSAMANFFDPGTFLVDTKVNLEFVPVQRPEGERPAEGSNGRTTIRESLPGLPGVPMYLLRPLDAPSDGNLTEFTLELRRIEVNMLVDADFTSDEINFVDQLIRATAKIDDSRGDRVTITRSAFPQRRTADSGALSSPPVTGLPDTFPGTGALTERPPVPPMELPLWEQILEEPVYWIPLLMLFGMLIGFLIWLLTRNRDKKNEGPLIRPEAPAPAPAPQAGPSYIEPALHPDTLARRKREKEKQEQAREDDYATYLLEQIMQYPSEMARLFEMWMKKEGSKGLTKAAQMLLLTDAKLVRVLRPAMSEARFEELSKKVEETTELPGEEAMKELKNLSRYLKARTKENTVRRGLRALNDFDFVQHEDDDRLLLHLIDYEPREIAVILSHLESKRAALMLREFESEISQKVMLELPKVKNTDYETYRKLAEDFFNRISADTDEARFKESDVAETVKLIESLPLNKQQEQSERFMNDENPYAAAVSSRMITFMTLSAVSDGVITEAIQPIGTEQLGLALAGMDSETAFRLIRLRPEREQMVLHSEMENASVVNEEKIADAKNRLLNLIRMTARKQQESGM